MPKMKTHKGAAKRFKVTGGGKIRRHKAWKSHLLAKKSSRRKRQLRQPALVHRCDEKRIRKLLPYH
ncbi:MAG: 50S ribosomal protein L35 [Clostridia bacterium]|nr:50S ribosomal protein L35 [Clostridia bacterium]